MVLCVDEKSQIQALDRSAPVLPLMPGVPERQTHDYVRNGTTNLYAALDVASGQVISDMTPRHRVEEFRRFLALVDLHRADPEARRRRPGADPCQPWRLGSRTGECSASTPRPLDRERAQIGHHGRASHIVEICRDFVPV